MTARNLLFFDSDSISTQCLTRGELRFRADQPEQSLSNDSGFAAFAVPQSARSSRASKTSDSIHYAGTNCVADGARWNVKRQPQQEEVDTIKVQLEEARMQLEPIEELAG